MSQTIAIDRPILEKMRRSSSVMLFSESGKIKEIIYFKNRPYVIMGCASSGEKGTLWVDAYGIIPQEHYKGDLTPQIPREHHRLVNLGKRERGYPGQIAYFEGVDYVITDEHIEFTPLESGIQLEMFQ